MAQYGAFSVFQRITADSLNAIIPQSITKQTTNGIVSNTTLTLDPELSGITLGVGTWSIEVMLLASPAATQATPVPSLKTGWSFTGTLANSPVRITTGPSSTNASIPTAMGSVNL